MVSSIYPTELKLKKANISDTQQIFLIFLKIYDKRDFNFNIANFLYLEGNSPEALNLFVFQ